MPLIPNRFRKQNDDQRIDPAPSRLNYRMQRWMLTPGIRLGLRIGVPFCLTLAVSSAFFADEKRRDALNDFVAEMKASIQERPEFMVKMMAIDGAGLNLAEDIREVAPLDFPISSFDIDIEQLRLTVAGLDPVKSASARIKPGGILQVDVIERGPAVVWRTRGGVDLLDAGGVRVDAISSRADRKDLPLIVGKGANEHVAEALRLIQVAAPLADRVRGLVRIGERRWDVVLDRGQRILLPVERPQQALERVLAVNEVRDLLQRDVVTVDMRLKARPTIRMTQNAVSERWRIRQVNGSGQ
jgi:cell division protein FtsQ